MKLILILIFLGLAACSPERPEAVAFLASESVSEEENVLEVQPLFEEFGTSSIVQVERPLAGITINAGQALFIIVDLTIDTTDAIEYRWHQNGMLIELAQQNNILKAGATIADSGLYQVSVYTIGGDNSETLVYTASAQVTVQAPVQNPQPDQQPLPDDLITQTQVCPNANVCREGNYLIRGTIDVENNRAALRVRIFVDGRFCALRGNEPTDMAISRPAYLDMVLGSRRIRFDTSTYVNGTCGQIP